MNGMALIVSVLVIKLCTSQSMSLGLGLASHYSTFSRPHLMKLRLSLMSVSEIAVLIKKLPVLARDQIVCCVTQLIKITQYFFCHFTAHHHTSHLIPHTITPSHHHTITPHTSHHHTSHHHTSHLTLHTTLPSLHWILGEKVEISWQDVGAQFKRMVLGHFRSQKEYKVLFSESEV